MVSRRVVTKPARSLPSSITLSKMPSSSGKRLLEEAREKVLDLVLKISRKVTFDAVELDREVNCYHDYRGLSIRWSIVHG